MAVPSHPRSAPRTAHPRLTDPFRLMAVRDTGLLDAGMSEVLDRLATMAAQRVGAPVALVSLVDDAGQHFPGKAGLTGWASDARGTPLSHSFCQHVVTRAEPLVVDDAALHPLVRDNIARSDLGVVAYAGVPLTTAAGETLGALCAIDAEARRWTAEQVAALEELAGLAVAELERRATAQALVETRARLAETEARLSRALTIARMAAWEWDVPTDRTSDGVVRVSAEWGPLFGRCRGSGPSCIADVLALVHPDDRLAVRIALDDAVAGRAAYEIQYRVPLAGGGAHTLRDAGTLRRDADGRVVRVDALVRLVADA